MFLRLNKILFVFAFVLAVCAGECANFKVLYGSANLGENGIVNTGEFDPYFIKSEYGNEIRLKHLTSLKINDKLTCLRLYDGVVGIKTASESTVIETENVNAQAEPNSIIVIKRTHGFDRVCVVKGNAVVLHKKNNAMYNLESETEIAASKEYLSKTYKRSDDMRFTWYWYPPEKEPSVLK